MAIKRDSQLELDSLIDQAFQGIKERKWSFALEKLYEALSISPNSAEILYNLGRVYEELESFEKALNCYRQSLQSDSRLLLAHINIGIILYKQLEFEAALDAYNSALLIDPFFF